jgi:hypothetical protein
MMWASILSRCLIVSVLTIAITGNPYQNRSLHWCPQAKCSSLSNVCDIKLLMVVISNPRIASEIMELLRHLKSIEVIGRSQIATTSAIIYSKVAKFSRKKGAASLHGPFSIDLVFEAILSFIMSALPSSPSSLGAPVHAIRESRTFQATVYDRYQPLFPCSRFILYGNEPALNRYIVKLFREAVYVVPEDQVVDGSVEADVLTSLVEWLGFVDCIVTVVDDAEMVEGEYRSSRVDGNCAPPFIL